VNLPQAANIVVLMETRSVRTLLPYLAELLALPMAASQPLLYVERFG